MTTIELDSVTQRYGATSALNQISLTFGPGVTGVLGPNGAGKTTLLRVMATVQEPTKGSVRILGHDAGQHQNLHRIRSRLGYLPQELGFPRGFTTFGFAEYVAVLKEWTDPITRRAEVRRVLEMVGLSSVSTKRVSRLSGGMRRRLGLAQALIGDPTLLLLDEPTTGLDPQQRASFRTRMLELAPRSTVVISTHQTDDVAALCSRVVVVGHGRVTFDGTVTDFVGLAENRVWFAASPDPGAIAYRRTASGRFRHVGDPPPGAEPAEADVEDAYLLVQHLSPYQEGASR